MKNIETSPPIPNLNKVITSFINNNIRFHTIQLFKKSKTTAFTPEGAGVLVEFLGIFCLLTTRQIVENTFDKDQLYFKLGPEDFLLCTGTIEESETNTNKSNINLSYIILDLSIAESLTEVSYKFLPGINILPHHDALETPHYTAVGFPKPTSGQDQENTQTNGSYIICPMAPDNYYDNHIYTKDENFIIPYTPPQNILTDIKTKSKDLCDMTGSGLWFIFETKTLDTVEYHYHLIGIITELYIHKRHHFLIATKINLITAQLKETLY